MSLVATQQIVNIIVDRLLAYLGSIVRDVVEAEFTGGANVKNDERNGVEVSGTPDNSKLCEYQDKQFSMMNRNSDVLSCEVLLKTQNCKWMSKCQMVPNGEVFVFTVFVMRRPSNVPSSSHLVVDSRGDSRDEGGGERDDGESGIGWSMIRVVVSTSDRSLNADGCFVVGGLEIETCIGACDSGGFDYVL